jgi:hypothetical protein
MSNVSSFKFSVHRNVPIVIVTEENDSGICRGLCDVL